MTLMQSQEDPKSSTLTLLKTSTDLGWSTIFAKLRSCSRREGPRGMPAMRVTVPRSLAAASAVRESDILAMISQGLSNNDITQALEISPETVKSYVKVLFF